MSSIFDRDGDNEGLTPSDGLGPRPGGIPDLTDAEARLAQAEACINNVLAYAAGDNDQRLIGLIRSYDAGKES